MAAREIDVPIVVRVIDKATKDFAKLGAQVQTFSQSAVKPAVKAARDYKDKMTDVSYTVTKQGTVMKSTETAIRSFGRGQNKTYETIRTVTTKVHQTWDQKLRRSGETLARLGWRIGFFGFLISFAGKQMMRTYSDIYGIMTKLIKLGVDWTDTLEGIAVGMALAESQGLLTAEMSDFLRSAINKLITIGPKLQAYWELLKAELLALGVVILDRIMPDLVKLFTYITAKVSDPAFREWLSAAAKTIVGELVPALIRLLEYLLQLAPSLIPLITNCINFMIALGPLAPALTVLGTALWALGPALTVVSVLMQTLAALYGLMAARAAGATIAESLHAASLAAKTPMVTLATAASGALASAEAALTTVLWAGIPVWAILAAAIIAVVLAILALTGNLDKVAKMINDTISNIGQFIGGMSGAKTSIDETRGSVQGLTDDLRNTCFLHASANARVFEDTLGSVQSDLVDLSSVLYQTKAELKEPAQLMFETRGLEHVTDTIDEASSRLAQARTEFEIPLRATANREVEAITSTIGALEARKERVGEQVEGETGTVEIVMYPEINIGSITGSADLATVFDTVSKGIASGVRRSLGGWFGP